ncbi:MAG TPA: hypothetical protein VNQ33_07095 [Acidimicrobiales bacterium]|nr:hypothetical protein [Acidimicrobiales bacterium]
MSRTTAPIAIAIAACALVLGLTACGSSSRSAGQKASTQAETDRSDGPETTTTTEGGGAASTTTVVAKGARAFCEDLAGYVDDRSGSDVDTTDRDGFKRSIQESARKGSEVLSRAPSELSGAVAAILDAQDQLIAALEKADYDMTKIPPAVLKAMHTPELEEASDEVDAYIADTCGIDLEPRQIEAPEVTATTVASPDT